MAKDNLNYLVCCANGAGSSLMMQMTMQKVLTKLNIKPGKVYHCSLSEGKSAAMQYDVIFCAQNFANMFDDAKKNGKIVIGLRNIMSPKEIEDKMRENGLV
jgi:PTS system ascorbate-specific IIB component